MSEVYLNGCFAPIDEARISPLDRGFLFADSVYEVIPTYGNALFRPGEHLQRLKRSLDEVAIRNPHSDTGWQDICQELLRRNGFGNRAVYIQVSRGAGQRRDHAFPSAPLPPTTFAMVLEVSGRAPSDAPANVVGYRVVTGKDTRWGRCDIKSTSLLANILLKEQAAKRGAAEVLLIRDGLVTEGATSNVFVVHGERIATPLPDNRILGGITRDLVIELCRAAGTVIEECDITEAELQSADEVWLTSSTREVVPVTEIDGRPVGDGGPGRQWRRVVRLFSDYKRTLPRAEEFR